MMNKGLILNNTFVFSDIKAPFLKPRHFGGGIGDLRELWFA
ncbi:hypothetical protein ACFLTQ_01350 [Chloroflexota bacterium]